MLGERVGRAPLEDGGEYAGPAGTAFTTADVLARGGDAAAGGLRSRWGEAGPWEELLREGPGRSWANAWGRGGTGGTAYDMDVRLSLGGSVGGREGAGEAGL